MAKKNVTKAAAKKAARVVKARKTTDARVRARNALAALNKALAELAVANKLNVLAGVKNAYADPDAAKAYRKACNDAYYRGDPTPVDPPKQVPTVYVNVTESF